MFQVGREGIAGTSLELGPVAGPAGSSAVVRGMNRKEACSYPLPNSITTEPGRILCAISPACSLRISSSAFVR